MKLKNYFIVTMLCLAMTLTGCLGIKIESQIKGDTEILSGQSFAITTIINVVKAKYPDKVDRLIRYCNITLASTDDEMFKAYFNNGLVLLADEFISDPVLSAAVTSILQSYKINIDTGAIDFDIGSLRTAKELIKRFRDQLAE
ncbi:MAG: hypothetical protein A2Y66_01720 [Nitrospirae bacterium RBG_13_41_22]|nr:MAG: hypothetical protein A2Y66_01720 [Nitrospirae bacterium RBG_13_41_22]